jgi:hypothetical protein
VIDDDYNGDDDLLSQKTRQEGPNKDQFTKDNPYTIFHALGKFLYNKSMNINELS